MSVLDNVLKGLMRRYQERVLDVSVVTKALIKNEIVSDINEISNDHIAFRTMGVPQLGIASFEKIFKHYGYERRDNYYFEQKKVNAKWYAPPESHLPRIFISELDVSAFSDEIQTVITSYTDQITADPVDKIDLDNADEVDAFLHAPLWETPSWEDYKTLQSASEYAAWVIYNRYYLNHYTISVHELQAGYNSIEEFNKFVKAEGVKLNNAGGEIKISEDGLLLQSSTVSQLCEATFLDGDKHMISGSYVEFAERKLLPEFKGLSNDKIQRHHRRDGFEVGNADKIFESTFLSQTDRDKE
ncbi:MAG: DUF1338 domain-containing protein [Flavobacteriales bacterium]|nr:DUF1338 domain-containing protein [Flavobacteriales bacterium]